MRSPVTVLWVVQQAPGGCRSFRLAVGCASAPAACVPVTLPRCCLAMPPPYTARLPTHSAGLVVASDQTDTLTRGYWPSFNVRSCAGTRLLPLRCSTERCAWHCARARPCLSTRAAGWHLGCMLLSSQPQPQPHGGPSVPWQCKHIADTVPQGGVQRLGLSGLHRTAGAARPAARSSSRCTACRRRAGAGVLAALLSPVLRATSLTCLPLPILPLLLAAQCSLSSCSGGCLLPAGATGADLPPRCARCAGKLAQRLALERAALVWRACHLCIALHQPDATAYHSMPICQPGLICGCECRTWAA